MTADSITLYSTWLLTFMFFSLLFVFLERIVSKKGIGARTIQVLGVLLIIPLIGILALNKVLEKQTTATLIGALTGYLLSGVGDYKPGSKSKEPINKQKKANQSDTE